MNQLLVRYVRTSSVKKKINSNSTSSKNDPNGTWAKLGSAIRTAATALATGYCITRFLAEPILLQGPSMEPTIQHNDVIIAEKYSAIFRKMDFKRGDIVVVRSPVNPNSFICKRIVALPGDSVRSHFFSKTVPSGHVWLLGDNTCNSTDSREFGALPMGLILGRVVCRVWPFERVVTFRRASDDHEVG